MGKSELEKRKFRNSKFLWKWKFINELLDQRCNDAVEWRIYTIYSGVVISKQLANTTHKF